MDELTPLIARHGAALVFLNALLTQLGLPLPAIPTFVVAGALVATGVLNPAALLLAAVAGSLLGDIPWYFAGRRYGYSILRTVCRVSIEPDTCVKQTENIFARWGPVSLVFAKYIPGFATIAPPLAGTLRLNLGMFIAYSTVGAALWLAVPAAFGYLFHQQVSQVIGWLSDMGRSALFVLLALLVLYVGIKAVERFLLIRFLRMARIGVEELKALMQDGEPLVVLDARSSTARAHDPRRIPGALPVDVEDPSPGIAGVTPDTRIIVYCS